MPKVININGIPVTVELDVYSDLCEELQKVNLHVEEVEDWSTKSYEDFKRYTAESLLDAANKYFKQTPPDMIQAAEKLWLSSVYSVKNIFLELKVHLVSHSSLKFFCEFALYECSLDKKTTRALFKAWTM
uniref:Uncharacterized protein n=1 Tax=Acrobeloides nanus TaxID=290746 RepID=A0A914CWN3_9BILA